MPCGRCGWVRTGPHHYEREVGDAGASGQGLEPVPLTAAERQEQRIGRKDHERDKEVEGQATEEEGKVR